ncbi:hypothetical protein [uncultured Tenacibaculum sp.]|uniref:hypothetical protein n=1 Tax=uncultured Tenacibaculum sp. TaxID=174713 RepID=UPI0026330A23|nr:hypothetical protein [uncultured Tenacibaculum sp.]
MKRKLLLLVFIPFFLCSQSTLSNAKQSLSSSSSTSSSSNSNDDSDDDDDINFFSAFFGEIFLDVFYYASLGIFIGEPTETAMNPYPYYNDKEGEYSIRLDGNVKKQSLKLSTNYLFNRVRGIEFNAVYKPVYLVGVELSHINFSENTLLNSESLNITSVNLNYYRIRNRNISMWWGLGVTYVGNGVNSAGVSYNFGTDIYPAKPISLHLGWKQSFINDNSVNVFKAQAKYHIKKTALYTGYHNYKLGSETVSGLVFGLEYTF